MLDQFDPRLDSAFSPVDPARLVAALSPLVRPGNLIASVEGMRPFESDGLAAYRSMPAVVILPETVAEVQAILRNCHQLGVPVVARGAGTGLSGGALPYPGCVLLSLSKFNRILSIDADGRSARVQPGVRNLAISEAVAHLGLFYAPDPSSQLACSIGGNVAENAGGVHCLKYGLTVHNILKLEVVTLEGEILHLGSEGLDAPGFDLMALMTGSEGLLGVITEITVKLLPLPDLARVILAAFEDVEVAAGAVATIMSEGVIPAGLEMMDGPALRAAEDFAQAGYPRNAAAILLCELDGAETEVAEEIARVSDLLTRAGAFEVRTAKDEDERRKFWAGRKGAFPAMGRLAPDYYCIDGTIPRRELPRVLTEMGRLAEAHGLGVANVFHAGDGNLHPLILYDASKDGDLAAAEALGGAILELCVEVGGTITGEHGVGREKINQMCVQFSPAEIETFFGLKAAFDPQGLLNPGKAIPTLARCSEVGGMHVHKGELPLPISRASDDQTPRLVDEVRNASARGHALRIVGGNTRSFYGRPVTGYRLEVSSHSGVIAYDPSELVITVRSGTPLAEIEALLAEHDQMLAFEPPRFGAQSTLGGVVASGLSGPRRPFTGSVRDFVLGVRLLDSRGEVLRFGGTVFKNVADSMPFG